MSDWPDSDQSSYILHFVLKSLQKPIRTPWRSRHYVPPKHWNIRVVRNENTILCNGIKGKGKGKAVPLQAWSGRECSRKLRFQDFITTVQDGGKVVSLTHRPSLPPGNAPGSNIC